ncbi:hypothetical protein SEEP3036_13464, partial [Salmonella enterica subsp. enterica serovar Pullorum str. 13036]
MLRICPGYRSMQSGSPDRRNAPPPGKEQIYIASTYFSITPAAIAEPITPATFGPIACISRKFCGSDS